MTRTVLKSSSNLLYRYLYETLGVRYIPQIVSNKAEAHNHIIWQHPHFQPQVIFFNQDPETLISEASTSDLLQKITKAMSLDWDKVWFVDSQNRSFMDFLNWLKSQNFRAPLVVMKKDPDIQNFIQNAGSFNWVECFSLQSMQTQTGLKKPTWQVLKLLLGTP